jgi:acyl carrier protein
MPETIQLREQIRGFILEKYPRARKDGLTDRSPLLESGLIDSLGILDLVGFLEEKFAIQVTDEELVPENFQNVDQLAVFVAQKKNGARESFA